MPVTPAEPAASLVAVGDISLRFLESASPLLREDPQRLIAGVGPVLAAADVRIGNLESVLTAATEPAAARGSFLRGAPRSVEVLVAAGFDAVTCGNNHCLDFGPESLMESLVHLQRHGIRTAGAGRTAADARCPVRITVRNICSACWAMPMT